MSFRWQPQDATDSWQKIRKTAANAYLGRMLKSFEFYIPEEAVHAWLVVMIILLGIGVLTLDRTTCGVS